MAKDSVSYVATIQESADGDLFIDLPQEIINKLGWKIGDEVEWEETEICEDWGEHAGITLGNLSKRNRDAKKDWDEAISTDME